MDEQANSRNGMVRALLVAGAALAARQVINRARGRGYDFAGRTVLITGGSRGLGLVLAREFAAEGARLAICARDEAALERARSELAERGAEVLAVPCDVGDEAEAQALVRAAEARFGHVDVLVNNAGIIQVGPLDTMTRGDWEAAMRTHFWGPLHTTLAVLPAMRERGEGRIVNISSIGGIIAVPHLLPYCASKFALTGLSEGLRAELAKDGIAVTTVCPGLMRTGSPRNVTVKGQHREEYAWFSISDALPVTAIGAERAARQIVAACRHGRAEIVLSGQALLASRLHGLFPGLVADAAAAVNRLLPGPGGVGTAGVKGSESTSALSPSLLTTLGEEAARRNNEIG